MATITNLGFNIFSRYSGDGVRQARRDIRDLANDHTWLSRNFLNSMNAMNGGINNHRRGIRDLSNEYSHMNRQARSLTSGMGAMRAGLLALAPALVPIGAVAAANAAGLAAMTVAAGSAVGAYVAVGNAAGKMALQMDAAGKKLTPLQGQYVKAVEGMRKAWDTLVKTTGEKTLQPQIEVIKGLTAGIKGLAPVIDAVHPVVMKVATAFRKWMEGPGFERFRDSIIKYGVPALDRLLTAGRNALAGLGIAFRTFLPMSEGLSKSILKASEAFRNWAEEGGFKRFMEYVKEHSPKVKEFFSELWTLIKRLGGVFKDIGPQILEAVTGLLKFLNAVPPEVLVALAGGFIALKLALTAIFKPLKLLTGLFGERGIGASLVRILPGLLKFGGILGGLVTVVALAWKHSEFFRDRVKELWEALKQLWEQAVRPAWEELKKLNAELAPLWKLLGQVAGFILGVVVKAITMFVQVLTGVTQGCIEMIRRFREFIDQIGPMWANIWQQIKNVADVVWRALQTAWDAVINAFVTAWQAVSGALKTAWDAVWNAMKVAVETVWNALKTAWDAVVNAFQVTWTTVSGALKTAWDAFWGGIRTAAEAVWNALKMAWDAVVNAFQVTWTTVSTALRTAWDTVWGGIRTAAEAVWNALKTAWDAFVNGLQTAWTTVSTALRTAWDAVWGALRTAAEAVWTALRIAWDAFLNAVQTAWNTVSSALRTAWDTVWNALKTAAETVWNALKLAWDTFLNAVQTAWNTVSAALRTAWDTVWNAIKTAAETVWNALKLAWDTFLAAVRTAWDTFSTALRTAWDTVWNALKTAAQAVWDALQGAWNTLLKTVRTIWDEFSSGLQTAWEKTWNTVRDIAKSVWNTIGGIIEKAVHGVIDVINGLIRGFNNITKFLEIDVSIGEIKKPQFPGLADGGMVMFQYGGMTGAPPSKRCMGKGCGGYAKGGVANLRHGGTLSGYAPGRDTVPAVLSRGEGVLTPEAVRGLGGPAFVNGANRQFAGHRGAGKGAGPMFRPSVPLGPDAYAFGGMVQHFAVGGMTAAALQRAGVPLSMVTQGEYSNGALSAGTHLGGGVVDLGTTDPRVLSRLIAAGFAAWIRGANEGMSPHIHAVLMNHPDLSGPARAQVSSFLAGGSGLGAGGGGGGGGIDIVGMITPHIGKILLNVYRGLEPLSGIAGAIADFFGGGGGGGPVQSDPDSSSDQQRRRELMERLDRNPNDRQAIEELADLTDTGVDRDSIMIQPAPFTGRPPVNAGRNSGDASNPNTNSLLANLAKYVLPLITREHIATGLGDAKKGLGDLVGGGGFGKIAQGFGNKLIDDVIPDFVMKKAEAATLPTLTMGGGNVQQWAGLAAEALARAGLSAGQLGAFLALMQAESGGNPNAINTTDINARNGNPSQGLMQVTGTTFAAYRDPSLPNNPRDPLANMVAAARYIKARYGGNVPGSPYADGTTNATPGLHLVGEEGPELVGLNGPMMAAFSGGQTVLPSDQTSALLSGTTGTGEGIVLPEKETQDLLNQGGFEALGKSAEEMAEVVKKAWTEVNLASAAQWTIMRDTTIAEAIKNQSLDMPMAATLMKEVSNASWLDMNLQSTLQWTALRDNVFLPAEDHMGVQMPTVATTMNTEVTAQTTEMATAVQERFTEMGALITEVMDAAIAKMDEFIVKAQEAIQVTAELVAAVQEAQAALAQLASMSVPGAGGAGGGAVGAGVEQWREMALQAMAAGGLDPSQIDAFLALMQAESSGNPNAVNNWDSNAAAGTPSMGLMQMIQPTFDAYNVTGGNIMDPYANMAASAAYIRARYGGVVPGSPYENGVRSATSGLHMVGEAGPELVGMNGPMMAWFRGGERVLTNEDTMSVLASAVMGTRQALIPALDETIAAIDKFIATARAGIEKAKAITAAAKAAAAARAAGGGVAGPGGGPCAMPNAPIIQGPYSTAVAASAGTHAGCCVYDFPADPATLGFLTQNNWAAWMRGNGDGMSPHIHAVCMSGQDLSPQAAWQVQDYLRGGSGLGIPSNLHTGTRHAKRGWSWVGERGPELMRMAGGEQVMSSLRSRRYWESLDVRGTAHEGGNITVEINFNGPVTNGDDVRRAVDEAIPKLRSALQARTGCRTGG